MRACTRRASRWSRVAALIAAAWCAVALGAPLALPVLIARATSTGAGQVAGMRAMGSMSAMTDMPGMTADAAVSPVGRAAGPGVRAGCDGRMQDAPAGRGDRHECCTCFGPCCHAAPAFAATPRVAFVADVDVVVPPLARYPFPAPYRPTPPEHARPPTIGPPVGPSA